MVDFWGSLALPSMGDIDIFAFNSQNSRKIGTSLLESISSDIDSSLLTEKFIQLCLFVQKIHNFPIIFDVNLYDL